MSERNIKFDGIKLEIWACFDIQLSINKLSIIFRLCYGRHLRVTKFGIHIHEASIHIWWKFSMGSACNLWEIIGFLQGSKWKSVASERIENDVISLSTEMRMRSGILCWLAHHACMHAWRLRETSWCFEYVWLPTFVFSLARKWMSTTSQNVKSNIEILRVLSYYHSKYPCYVHAYVIVPSYRSKNSPSETRAFRT